MVDKLPIDNFLPEITSCLKDAGAVVLKAEPGAGKTTRVPPAILDAGLAELTGKRPGQIVVLQPRRVAARAAASRMSDERGTTLGAEIGYQVRLEGKFSPQTRILVCTEGIFLRRLQDDPLLEKTAVVVFDEFHERSLDGDLCLAMSKLVREQVRADLRLVVMSATLDSAPISQYLGNCPVIESPGRTFPVDISYLQFPSNLPAAEAAAAGTGQMLPQTPGHLLVFLPGVGEIRQAETALARLEAQYDFDIMPLYGEMPLEEQQAVLRPSKRRKVVLSTNIAETSITIDGVTGVVDSGLARVNRFDPHIGLNRLELGKISKASAAQRAGRAGRTAAGACLRLWTEKEQQMLPEFESPEIARVDLSEAVLRLFAWGEKDLANFPWFEQPPAVAVEQAIALLDRLDAIAGGAVTQLGTQMASLPLQPRLARLMIEGARLGNTRHAALCAAMLSERTPFRRIGPPAQAQHHSDSDVIDRLHLLDSMRTNRSLKVHFSNVELLPGAARQVVRAAEQLMRLVPTDDSRSMDMQSDESILRALASAFPDRICKRRQLNSQKAVMVGGRGVRLSEESAVQDADLFVAVEVTDTNRAELIVHQASRIERNWLPESHLSSEIDVSYDPTRQKVVALKRTRFCDLVLDESIAAIPADVDAGSVLAAALCENFDVGSLVDDQAKDYLARVRSLREWLPELNLPEFSADPWRDYLTEWCCGCSSVAELKQRSIIEALKSRLTAEQIAAIDREAPERISLPKGRFAKLMYEPGKPPVLAARIQELFGLTETPRVARARIPVLVHLLAPNYRIQQITPDLASFWKNTYAEVRKELKGRYPKHAWPENPHEDL